jgi:hypothetical protein
MDHGIRTGLQTAVTVGLVMLVIGLWTLATRQPAARDPATGGLILRFPRFLGVVVGGSAAVMVLLMIVASFAMGFANPNEGFIMMAVGAAFLVIGSLLSPYLLMTRVRVSPDGVTYDGVFVRGRTVAWQEIGVVRCNLEGSLVLISTRNTKIRVARMMEGVRDLPGILEKRLPAHVRGRCRADLNHFRESVHRDAFTA